MKTELVPMGHCEKLTFEKVPEAIWHLSQRLENIERLLKDISGKENAEPEDLLTVEGAAKFLSLSKATVYALMGKGELPCMKRSKRSYFLKEDLLNYLKAGRTKTFSEIESETDNYLVTKRRKH